MKYKDYTADDLIKDEFFQQWVFSPTEESNRFWLDYLENYPQHHERIEEARQFLSFFHVKDKDVFESRISSLKKKINHSIDNPEVTDTPSEAPKLKSVKRFTNAKWIRVAVAATLFAIGLTALLYAFIPREDTTSSSEQRILSATIQQHAPLGKRTMVLLPDGTRAFLNAGSTLEYARDFIHHPAREVTLEGEAFFEVAENLQKRFVVNMKTVNISALAASFNVRAYLDEPSYEIVLVTGKVTVESKIHPLNQLAMLPNQQVIFDKESEAILLDNEVNTEIFTAWRNGDLIFENESFGKIKAALERWYAIQIEVEDKAALECHFSARFNNKTIKEVLDMMKTSDELNFEIKKDRVVIHGRLCE